MPGFPIAVTGDMTDTKFGPSNVIASVTPTVLAGGKPVATVGAQVAPHGNYTDPKRPGFNPICASAVVAAPPFSSTVLVEGKPVAIVGGPGKGTQCSCTYHSVLGPGVPTVIVGL
jgi:uncharacterized Zn-binding protein involved in type VI secretion